MSSRIPRPAQPQRNPNSPWRGRGYQEKSAKERVEDWLKEQGRSPWDIRLPVHYREVVEQLNVAPQQAERIVEELRWKYPEGGKA